jgi:hypothetical protein
MKMPVSLLGVSLLYWHHEWKKDATKSYFPKYAIRLPGDPNGVASFSGDASGLDCGRVAHGFVRFFLYDIGF